MFGLGFHGNDVERVCSLVGEGGINGDGVIVNDLKASLAVEKHVVVTNIECPDSISAKMQLHDCTKYRRSPSTSGGLPQYWYYGPY